MLETSFSIGTVEFEFASKIFLQLNYPHEMETIALKTLKFENLEGKTQRIEIEI